MTRSNYFEWSMCLLYCLGTLIIWLADESIVQSIALSSLCGLLCLTRLNRFFLAHTFLWLTSISVIGLAFTVGRFLDIDSFDDLAQSMIALLAAFLPATLTFRAQQTSYWLTILNLVVIGIGCLLLGSSLLLYAVLILFLIVLVFNLNSAQLLVDAPSTARQKLPRHYFRQFNSALPIGAVCTACVFYLFPRVSNIDFGIGGSSSKTKTGYTGVADLSGTGPIEQSGALALQVASEDSGWLRVQAGSILLRGNALSRFDGVRWSGPAKATRKSYASQIDLRIARRHSRQMRNLSIFVEPTSTRTIFYPGVMIAFAPPSRGLGGVFTDGKGQFFRGVGMYDSFNYALTSATVDISGSFDLELSAYQDLVLDTGEPWALSDADLEESLAIPTAIAEAGYFKNFVERAGPIPTTLGAAIANISQIFRREFEATLERAAGGQNALEAFLGPTRRGHCELFATAAALYFRAVGIPARLTLGYRGGDFNPVSNLLEVREANAHAWVEVYIPTSGWIEFDPTPQIVDATPGSIISTLGFYATAANFWFKRYVLEYDQETQRQLMSSLASARIRQPKLDTSFDISLAWLSLPAALFTIILGLTLVIRREKNPVERLPKFYRLFLRRIRSAGLAREPHETYRQFHRRVAANLADNAMVREVDAHLEGALYAEKPLPTERDLHQRLKKFRTRRA